MNIYPWQQQQWQRLNQMYHSDRMPHAILLNGQHGLGLDEFAKTLAVAILADAFTEHGAEPSESKDWQLFQSGNHPDFSLVEPEEPGKAISVDQIRRVIDFLQYTSQYNRKKIVLIHPAENMNRNAANGLLKTLEEPPGNSLIILVSYQSERLPVTIRSRCQKLNFSYHETAESAAWIKQHIDSEQQELAMMLAGAPLLARQMIETDQLAERSELIKELCQLQKKQLEPISIAERWNSIGAGITINALLSFFNDMAKLKLTSDETVVTNRDIIKNLLQIIKRLDLFSILACYRLLLELNHKVLSSTSYNTQGLLEEFILRWQALATEP